MRDRLHRGLGVVVICGLLSLAGCKQQLFLNKECFDQAHEALPATMESDYTLGNEPSVDGGKSPPTLRDPDRPVRHLTLREAFAIALENGSESGFSAFSATSINQGGVDDRMFQFATGAGATSQTTRIKALALNPAISGANLEASLARFDAHWVTSMNWTTTDNLQQNPAAAAFINGQSAAFSSSVVKALASGGVASTTLSTNYRNAGGHLPDGIINPFYESRLQFGFEQPLWRDYGVEINQLLARFPTFAGTGATSAAAAFNSRQVSGNNLGIGNEGILISRIRMEQQRAEFERVVNNLLLNVENAYWRLYQAYGRLYSFEEVMRIAHKSWLTNQAKFVAGTIGPANYHPIRGQYEEFRGERMASLGAVLDAERNLRGLLGLPVEDGTRLIPIDAPTLAPYQPNWETSVQAALLQRPELAMARDNLRVNQYALVSQKNFLKPDLRFQALYSPVGFGSRLDGNGVFDGADKITRPSNALRALSNDHFNDWTVGLTMSMPIGFRLESAAVRAARLQLAQSYYLLKDQEERAVRVLSQQYQKLAEWYQLVEARRAERKAYAESVEARFREFAVGKTTVADFLLEAQRRLAAAQVKEYEAIAEYNASLARFEWAKGNLLRHNNIVIAEGPIPDCVEVRAVDHERERAKAIILREKPSPLQTPGRLACNVSDLPQRLEVPAEVSKGASPQSPGVAGMPVASPGSAPRTVQFGEPTGVPHFKSVPAGYPSQGSRAPRALPVVANPAPALLQGVEPATAPIPALYSPPPTPRGPALKVGAMNLPTAPAAPSDTPVIRDRAEAISSPSAPSHVELQFTTASVPPRVSRAD